MLAVALEDRMLADIDHYIEVARRPAMSTSLALATETDAVASIDAGRHFHRQGLVLFHTTLTMAGAARIGNHLAVAMATRAGLLYREEALLHAHLTDTTASGTGHRRSTRFSAAAAAGLAADQGRHADGHGSAAHRIFQVEIEGVAQVRAALHTAARAATTAATEEIAEDVAEDVREARAAKTGAGARAHLRIDTGMTVLIVGRTLARVGQDLVGLVGLLEFLLGLLVAGIAVRVVLHGQPTISLLQLRLAGTALDTQYLVEITLGHNFPAL
ncbi:hypothetical protein D3C78_791000 [compost metagenome]